jgi:recombination protein RecT
VAPAQARTLADEMRSSLRTHEKEFEELLPKSINVTRFIRVATWTIQSQPRLAQCSGQSIVTALLRCATDGLLPDGRQAALVPYEIERDGRREMACQYQPMIAGIRDKVFRAGELASWNVNVVQEGDSFDFEFGSNQYLRHKPSLRGGRTRPVTHAYSVAKLKDGGEIIEVMNIDQIEDVRKKSKSRHGPWSDPVFFPEMCRKTVAKLAAKALPMPEDVTSIFRRDDEYESGGAIEGPAPSRARPSSTRESLEAYAPKQQTIVEESENPAPPESPLGATPANQTIPVEQPLQQQTMPTNTKEYFDRFHRTLATATNKKTAGHVQQWFGSDFERRLRTKCGISFPDLDRLETELKEHLSKFEEGQ